MMNIQRANNKPYWLAPYYGGGQVAATDQTFVAGRIYLAEFEVLAPLSINQITYRVGSVSNGNVIVGIYRAVTRDTAANATLVVQSASVAQAAIDTVQNVSIATTNLVPGLYYAAIHPSSSTGTYYRVPGAFNVTGWVQYDAQAFGALPSTITATPTETTFLPGLRIRVV